MTAVHDEFPQPELRSSDAVNLAGEDTGRMRLSHTRLAVFLACHRKYELDYIERLELIAKPRHLSLGSAFQKGVEHQDPEVGVRLLNGFELCSMCGGAGGYSVGEDGDTFWNPDGGDYPCPTCNGKGMTGEQIHHYSQEAEDQHRIDEVIVRSAVELYMATWPEPVGETREFEWMVQLRSPWTGALSKTFDLHGYSDALVEPDNGDPYELTENKLVGRIDPASVKRLPLDRQLALNRYGIWRATGTPVGRVNYRWVKKPSIKQRAGRKKDKSDAETLDQFLERLAADYKDRPDFYAVPNDPMIVTTEDLLRVECELWEWAEDVRAKLRPDRGRPRIFDRNTSRCTDYGGCQFLPICTGDPDAGALYRVRPERDALEEDRPEGAA